MILAYRAGAATRNMAHAEKGGPLADGFAPKRRGFPGAQWSSIMKWVTPTATDFRFGMEITMYIANR